MPLNRDSQVKVGEALGLGYAGRFFMLPERVGMNRAGPGKTLMGMRNFISLLY